MKKGQKGNGAEEMRKYIHTHTYTHNHGAWQLFVEILTCKLWNLKINICKNNAKTIYSSSSTGKKHHNLTYDTVSTSSSYMLQYCTFMPLTVVLIILSFPSPTLSFIPDLKPSFSANPSHCSLSFSSSGLTTWFPRLLLLLLSFFFLVFCFTLFSCCFREVD